MKEMLVVASLAAVLSGCAISPEDQAESMRNIMETQWMNQPRPAATRSLHAAGTTPVPSSVDQMMTYGPPRNTIQHARGTCDGYWDCRRKLTEGKHMILVDKRVARPPVAGLPFGQTREDVASEE